MHKRAVVTGAASGVGLACTRRLLSQGWSVTGLDISAGAPELAEEYPERCEMLSCDVTLEASVTAALAQAGSRIDALVCCAGILRVGPLAEMAVADFTRLFAVNVTGAWLCARAAIPYLRRGPGEDPARIIFIGSIAMLRPKVGTGAYAASKAALAMVTRVMAVELAADGILVNSIAPGSMDTPMTRAVQPRPGDGAVYRRSGMPPAGRLVRPEDVADVLALLLEPRAAFVTGVTLPVDGGASAAYLPDTT